MVLERVGDRRSVWRYALAGLLAGVLVVATSQTTAAAMGSYSEHRQRS
jgi:hypothetical protein